MPRRATYSVPLCDDSTSVGTSSTFALLLAVSPLKALAEGCTIPHHLGDPLAVDGLAKDELARRCRGGHHLAVRYWRHRSRCP